MTYLLTSLFGSFGIIGTVFWVWMIYDCLQNERDRQTWLWILIFLNLIGALLYFITRWMPRTNVPTPSFAKRWTRRNALWQAEAEAKNIGKLINISNLATFFTKLAIELKPKRPISRHSTKNQKILRHSGEQPVSRSIRRILM